MRHKPCCLIGDAQHAFDLFAADAFFAGGNEVCGHEPFVKGDLGTLKDSADCDRELTAAVATEVKPITVGLTVDSAVALYASAVRADRAVGPAQGFQILAGSRFVVESYFGKDGCGHGLLP